jgi:hypothetical protein
VEAGGGMALRGGRAAGGSLNSLSDCGVHSNGFGTALERLWVGSACHHWGAASKVAPTPVTPLLTGSLARARKFSVDAGLRRAPSTRIRPARLLWSVREGFWLCERGRQAMQLCWKNACISVGVRRPRCQERR